ncbi:MAG: hypothetical protein ACRBBV_16500 [Paracoccaceae bacterium]
MADLDRNPAQRPIERIVSAAVLREARARVQGGEALVNGAWVHGQDRARLRARLTRQRSVQRLEMLLVWGVVALFGLILVALAGMIA